MKTPSAIALVAGLFWAAPVSSAEPGPVWVQLGLSGGGNMYMPAISGADPDLMMLSCDMSGAYISTDGGHRWNMIHHRQLTGNTSCKPGMHPRDPNVIYASSNWAPRTLKVTRDRGMTWTLAGEAPMAFRGEIVLDPDNPELLIAGQEKGACLSRDGGKTWTACAGPDGEGVAFHFDRTSPADKRRVFAATKKGVWRSDNGGETWAEKTSGLPEKAVRHFSGGSNAESGVTMLYCSAPAKDDGGNYVGGIYRSKDGGETWVSAMGAGINMDVKPTGQWGETPIAQYKFVLTTDAKPMTVCAWNIRTGFEPPCHNTVFRSDDGGKHWRATYFMDPRFKECNTELNYVTATLGQSFPSAANGAAVCPSDPERFLYLKSDLRITHDGGRTWFNGHTLAAPGEEPKPGSAWLCNGLGVTSAWHYYVDPFKKDEHYIAYTDIGFACSRDRGKTWSWWKTKDGRPPWLNTCYEMAFDPETPGKVWGAFSDIHDIPNGNTISWWRSAKEPEEGRGGFCVSEDSCAHWTPLKGGLPEAPATSIVLDPKSPKDARTLYAGVFGKGVFKSTDGGKTWSGKSEGLGAPSNLRVYRVMLHKDGTLFASITGKRAGDAFRKEGVGVYRSRDGAERWERITKDPEFLWLKDFNVHPDDSKIVFVGAADARGGGEEQGGLYRTVDGGETWKRVVRAGRQHFGAYFHPHRPKWVYLTMCEGAVESPLQLSTDGGDTWEPFKSFPFGNTQRVYVDPEDDDMIYVCTFGGSVFRGPAAP
ncbi:MAG: hypothetical protein M5U26_07980 [Planctomycetota bacterium]|nr:hypothetical protein [Planctomycetota bacterium]